jgi:hypothetical protein
LRSRKRRTAGTMGKNFRQHNMTFLEMFERELEIHNIGWCQGCDLQQSHRRGFAWPAGRMVHLTSKMERRASLLKGLHEIGHVVANTPGMKRWEREKSATDWAYQRMRELGVSIPREKRGRYRRYISRLKRWGKNIATGRKSKP